MSKIFTRVSGKMESSRAEGHFIGKMGVLCGYCRGGEKDGWANSNSRRVASIKGMAAGQATWKWCSVRQEWVQDQIGQMEYG